jgi:class 3 adenylate cyclase/predicted metal-dependent HD superfamily phosphohydrolase
VNLKNNTVKYYTVENGLPNNVIYGILKDNNNNLWMSTNKGVCKFNIQTEETVNYYESDGLQSNEFNTGAYFKSKTGIMFFGGINGFNMFNPTDIKQNPYPPKIVFTDFFVNNLKSQKSKKIIHRAFVQKENIPLAYYQNFITVSFSALHFSAPEKNKYRYKLHPINEEWIDLGNSHQVFFSNLEPGEYTLEVIAANADGVWTPKPITLHFTITPPFWKTWWFRISVIGALLLIAFLYYHSRIQMIKRQKELLEMQVLERTARIRKQKERIEKQKAELEQKQKELELEKEKSEQLLLNILPEKTVTELKIKGKSKPRHYNLVSVMFADFKNFTKISENLRPEELVQRLDSYFIKFDEIIEEHHVEKIKTMGDAYMAAAGVPIRNKTNPIDITLAALRIQQYMRQSNEQLDENSRWYLRIGIHTGEVTAGVIGLKRFAYDIWGDTVNVASRVETSGEPGKVNVSGQTYEQIKAFFDCEYRGKIPAKNKGEIDMYFVNRIKPELSEDKEGTRPNKQFWDYVNLHIFSQINYRKAEKYILDLLQRELPDNLYYHSINHTIDVTEAVERLALMEGVKGEDIFLLKTAALYHDAGFVKQYDKNEPIGAQMAAEVLDKFGYTEQQIKIIQELILATAIPQQPKNKLQAIICDADLDYLGRDDFHTIADLLKKELMERGKITSDRQWDEIQVSFLTAHKYHTKSAIRLRQEKKDKHLEEIKERLKNYG